MSRIPDEMTRQALAKIENRMTQLCAEGGILGTRGSRPYREEMTELRKQYRETRDGAINEQY